MKLASIDTTVAKVAKVKILEGSTLLAETEKDSPLVALKEALGKSGLKLSDIDKFESNPGPGSYTGIRVGAAVCNTLNWVLGKDAKAIEPIYE